MPSLKSLQSRVIHLDNAKYTGGIFTTLPQYIVWHCTDGGSALEAIHWLNRDNSTDPASYHYVIDTDGTIYRMCQTSVVAYHAGKSWWPEPVTYHRDKPQQFETRSLNRYSFGIAFANTDMERASLTREQVSSGQWLGRTIMDMTMAKIPPEANLGHREVAPGRKADPSPLVLSMAWWRNVLGQDYLNEQHLYAAYLQAHRRV